MSLSRIAHVALGVPDLDAAIDFYGAIFGLAPLERKGASAFLASGRSSSFELELGPFEAGMDHFAFGVRPGTLSEVAARLSAAGVVVAETAAAEQPGLERGIAFALPSGHVMELVVQSEPKGFVASSQAAPAHHQSAAGSVPLEHITLLSSDIRSTAEFLIADLGFSITDSWQPQDADDWRNTWMRVGELHHDLSLLPAPGQAPELHHFCFAVPSVAELVRVADALASRGMPVDASIGRHVAGNNIFLYFKDPFGNRVEVNTDMARVDPAAQPRILREPLPFDAWREGRPPALASGSRCRDARTALGVGAGDR